MGEGKSKQISGGIWLGEGGVHCHYCHVYLFFSFFLTGGSSSCPVSGLSQSEFEAPKLVSTPAYARSFLPSPCPLCLLYANSQK